MALDEALVAGDTNSEPNQATIETGAVEDVIEVGGGEEDESTNSETEKLPVARTRAGRVVKRPREYQNAFDSKSENRNQLFFLFLMTSCEQVEK